MNAELLGAPQNASGEEQKRLVEGIVASCKTATRQLNDFLDIAQIESGRMKINRVKWSLVRLVRSCLAVHRANAERKKIDIALQEAGVDRDILIDPDRARQVIDNLVENAIKYSPLSSKISVDVEGRDGGFVFAVRDQGPGLSPQQVEQLFQPFKSVGSETTGGERSHGLGLAIVKSVMEGHGGWIRVQSEPGRGAKFEAWFPG